MKKFLTLPNCITLLRILGTAVMAFMKPLTQPFFLLYSFLGLTDAMDGYLARKTKTAGAFGAKLDSVADLLFYSVMVLKILPRLAELLPWQFWWVLGSILVLRLTAYAVVAIRDKQFAAYHTPLNKLSGFAVFCVPYILNLTYGGLLCWIPCVIGLFASGEELLIHTTSYGNHYKMKKQKSDEGKGE